MSLHTLTVAALAALLLLVMALLVADVTCIEPGAWERRRQAVAYHRTRAKQTKHATTLPALMPARTT